MNTIIRTIVIYGFVLVFTVWTVCLADYISQTMKVRRGDATITAVSVKQDKPKNNDLAFYMAADKQYVVNVKYTFKAYGKTHTGNRIEPVMTLSGFPVISNYIKDSRQNRYNYATSEKIKSHFKAGKKTDVYYNDNNPSQSFLIHKININEYLIFLFLTVVTVSFAVFRKRG